MFQKNVKFIAFLLIIKLGLISAAPMLKCLDSSQVETKLDHHKFGYLLVDKILGKELNAECLKNVEFLSIKLTGLENYRICAFNKNLKLIYPKLSINGRYKAALDPLDTTTFDEDTFTIKLTDLIVNFSLQAETDKIVASVQHGIKSPNIKIPDNESLMKCISSTESLIAQQVIKYANYELKTVLDETWNKIGTVDAQSQENSSQISMKNLVIVFYNSLLKSLYSRDNS